MGYRILLSDGPKGLCQALLQEDVLVEYSVSDRRPEYNPGTVILGCVQETASALEAAFVNIGTDTKAFLPLDGRNVNGFKTGTELPVQIKKAPHERKGAAVSEKIEFPSPYFVLVYGEKGLGVSGKIKDEEERKRLLNVFSGEKQKGSFDEIACVIRTEAEGLAEEELLNRFCAQREEASRIIRSGTCSSVGTVLSRAPFLWEEWLRKYQPDEIVAEDRALYRDITARFAEKPENVRLYQDSSVSLFDLYRIPSQLANGVRNVLFLDGGGSVVFDETVALIAIDVNTGKGQGVGKEAAVLSFNKKAAVVIASQLRLRNYGGVIMIDFVNMRDAASREELIRAFRDYLSSDPAKIRIYGFTATGILEMTRERRGAPLKDLI